LPPALALGLGAYARNRDYRSETSIWADTVLRRPVNPRARLALGEALSRTRRGTPRPQRSSRRRVRLDPGDFEARGSLGLELFRMGRVDEALAEYRLIAPPTPDSAPLHCDIGMALERSGRSAEAIGRRSGSTARRSAWIPALTRLARGSSAWGRRPP
jgi:Flp pilus assembly protein TadD